MALTAQADEIKRAAGRASAKEAIDKYSGKQTNAIDTSDNAALTAVGYIIRFDATADGLAGAGSWRPALACGYADLSSEKKIALTP
jgi:hypothetical protein